MNKEALEKASRTPLVGDEGDAAAIVHGYLSTVWKRFDADDESTWPEKFTPNNGYWLIFFNSDSYTIGTGGPANCRHRWANVTHYADPADLFVGDV